MSNKEKLLENLGLKSTAVQIYLYLLSAKKATVLEVAKETGIARTNIYNNITRLIQMGLIGEAIEGGKKFLIPESPNNLINFVKVQEQFAKQAAGLLQEDFETNKYESKIRFGQGKKDFQKFTEEMLLCNDKQIRQFTSLIHLLNYSSLSFLKKYWKKRAERNIYSKLLIPKEDLIRSKQLKINSPSLNIEQLREIRLRPENLKISMNFAIFDNKVNFIAPPNEGYTFLFESPAFADTMKSIFDYIWQKSERIT